MKYEIGQKVVYIGPDFSKKAWFAMVVVPVPMAVYTIRGRRILPLSPPEPGYVFEEIVNREAFAFDCGEVMELHCNEKFLRPLVSRPTDISVFHEIRLLAEQGTLIEFPDGAMP